VGNFLSILGFNQLFLAYGDLYLFATFFQVEIVMGLEEAFGISVEEESAQSIATVQDAADLIEKLVEKKD
jgi:uncharacterized protein (DUF697 family)